MISHIARIKFVAVTMVAATLGTMVGCGGGGGLPSGQTGTVKGKVTFQGQPVPKDAVVTFINTKTGIIGTGLVSATGEYTLAMKDGNKILCGDYKVGVTPPAPQETLSQDEIMKLGQEGKLPKPPEYKEIPERYRATESSPLAYTVKAGDQTYDIDMKEKD